MDTWCPWVTVPVGGLLLRSNVQGGLTQGGKASWCLLSSEMKHPGDSFRRLGTSFKIGCPSSPATGTRKGSSTPNYFYCSLPKRPHTSLKTLPQPSTPPPKPLHNVWFGEMLTLHPAALWIPTGSRRALEHWTKPCCPNRKALSTFPSPEEQSFLMCIKKLMHTKMCIFMPLLSSPQDHQATSRPSIISCHLSTFLHRYSLTSGSGLCELLFNWLLLLPGCMYLHPPSLDTTEK